VAVRSASIVLHTDAARGTYNELEAEKTAALAAIAQLDATDQTEPGRPRRRT
jgi:site-specific DNA recombinase